MKRTFSALLLSGALLAPIAVRAADDEHHDKDRRVYDKDHRDWHEWNEREDKAYRRFLEEKHREYREFGKANRHEQSEYWKWRHEHPDEDRR